MAWPTLQLHSRLGLCSHIGRAPRPPLRRAGQQMRAGRQAVPQAAAKDVWAFDFDGVVCDSVGESSESAWEASARKWPELFARPEVQAQRAAVLDKMRETRPVIETGYENLVLVRHLLDGAATQDVMRGWPTLLPELMAKWDLDRGELVQLFGTTRDEWIERDLSGWLAANAIYPGLPDILGPALDRHEVYVVTTKQARFTEALLQKSAGVPLPADRIFSTTTTGQPKGEVLALLQERHPDAPTYHFIEDKLATLHKVEALPALEHWKLYLVDWGYNTTAEKKDAQRSTRIELIGKQRLQELLA